MDFYTVDPDYMEYLQDFETEKRGFSRVPNIRYKDRNKFTFGAVLDIGDFHYYVTLSCLSTRNTDFAWTMQTEFRRRQGKYMIW